MTMFPHPVIDLLEPGIVNTAVDPLAEVERFHSDWLHVCAFAGPAIASEANRTATPNNSFLIVISVRLLS
jgi:hypothetical protein